MLDKGKVSSSGAKLSNSGPHQHSPRESNMSRKHVMSEGTESVTELKRLPTPIDLYEDECAFCHSFRTTQFHGPMVCYIKGRIVSIHEGKPSNGIYVHRKCLEWSPRVWFEGDIVMNLELEISRASRLRCSRCGLPGAALGCYYKQCNKSFHVPCAVQIFDCRWDVDDGLMLCSEHVSKTLPCDELSSQSKERDNFSSLPQSSHKEESFTSFQEEAQPIDQLNTRSSFVSLGEQNFDNYQVENQQSDQLDASKSSSLPQSQCSQKEEISISSSREGQQIDQLNLSISSSLRLGQHSSNEGISNDHDWDGQQRDEPNTSDFSSLPRSYSSCHPDKVGISNAWQAEEVKADQQDTSCYASDQWVLLGSSLSASEKETLQEFACWNDARVTNRWAKNVTHVIVGKSAVSTWNRSYEVLMAILFGKWVVRVEWILDRLEELPPGPEASYEITFSNASHTINGPTKGRIRAAEGAPKLFSGLHFCLSAYLKPDDRERMQDLIAAAGGKILQGDYLHLQRENLDDSSVKTCFVYDGNALKIFTPSPISLLDLHYKEIEEVTKHEAGGAQAISHFQVLEAIAAYDAQILNQRDCFTPYTPQQSDKDGLSHIYERHDQQTDELNTSNVSLPQGYHLDKGISSGAYQREEVETHHPGTSSYHLDQLVLLGSSLSASEKDSFEKFSSWTKATVTTEWAENVTHVIVGKNARSAWSRSYDVLMAILFGKWVVQVEWIVDCLEMRPDLENSYEVTFSSGSHRPLDGPKKGRTRAAEGVFDAPKLFSGLHFGLSAYMNPDERDRMRNLIAAAGGRVLEGGSSSLHMRREDPSTKPYFVYDGGAPREFSASSLRMEVEEAREHAAAGARVISHLVVLDAVAAYDAGVLNQKEFFGLHVCS